MNINDYKANPQGALVPLSLIKPLDLQRDEVVNELFDEAVNIQMQIIAFKKKCYDSINAHRELSASEHEVKIDLEKDGVSLRSYNGRRNIKIRLDSVIKFDEKIYEAKSLLDGCMADWAQDSSSEELKLLIHELFNTPSGSIDVKGLLSLRRYKISHEKWKRAMDLIHESVDRSQKKSYIRFYQREGNEKKLQQLVLNFTQL